MFKSYKSSCISSINVNFHPRSAAAYVVVGCWAGSHPFKNESKKSSDCMFFLSVVTRHSCCKDVLMQKKNVRSILPHGTILMLLPFWNNSQPAPMWLWVCNCTHIDLADWYLQRDKSKDFKFYDWYNVRTIFFSNKRTQC